MKKYLLILFVISAPFNFSLAELPDCLKYGPYFCTKTMRDKIEMMNRGSATLPQELIDFKDQQMKGEQTTYIERITPPLYGQSPDKDPESRISGREAEIRRGMDEYRSLIAGMGETTQLGDFDVSKMCVSAECKYFAENPKARENLFVLDRGNSAEDIPLAHELERAEMLEWMHPLLGVASALSSTSVDLDNDTTVSTDTVTDVLEGFFEWQLTGDKDDFNEAVTDAIDEAVGGVVDSVGNTLESFSGPALYMAGQRQDQPFAHYPYCGIPEIVGVCTHLSQYNIPYVSWFCELDENLKEDNEIYWGYRVPFQKVETVRNPFATAYLSKQMMGAMLPVSKAIYSSMISSELKNQFAELKQKTFFYSLFEQAECFANPELRALKTQNRNLYDNKCKALYDQYFNEIEKLRAVLPERTFGYEAYQSRFCVPYVPSYTEEDNSALGGTDNTENVNETDEADSASTQNTQESAERTAWDSNTLKKVQEIRTRLKFDQKKKTLRAENESEGGSAAITEDAECLAEYQMISAEMQGELAEYASPQPTNITGIYNTKDELTKMYNLITATYPEQIFPEEWKDNEYDNVAFVEALKENPTNFFFRDPNQKNTINVEFRVVNSGFHETYRSNSAFNAVDEYDTWSVPYSWLHCGAPLSNCKEKFEVGTWFSDFPQNILPDKFREPNYAWYGDEMFSPSSNGTCRSGIYAREQKDWAIPVLQKYGIKDPGSTVGKKVPHDILAPCFANTPEEQAQCDLDLARQKEKFDVDARGKCIEHTSLGEKFDKLSRAKAKYTYEASLIGLYRGLRDALTKGPLFDQPFHDVQWNEEGAPMTPTFRPRDYIQLMGQAGNKFKGCYATKPPDHPWVIPLHHGATYEARPNEDDQIEKKWDEEINERYTYAHWRYLQACPPLKIGGSTFYMSFGDYQNIGCYVPVGIWARGMPYIME